MPNYRDLNFLSLLSSRGGQRRVLVGASLELDSNWYQNCIKFCHFFDSKSASHYLWKEEATNNELNPTTLLEGSQNPPPPFSSLTLSWLGFGLASSSLSSPQAGKIINSRNSRQEKMKRSRCCCR